MKSALNQRKTESTDVGTYRFTRSRKEHKPQCQLCEKTFAAAPSLRLLYGRLPIDHELQINLLSLATSLLKFTTNPLAHKTHYVYILWSQRQSAFQNAPEISPNVYLYLEGAGAYPLSQAPINVQMHANAVKAKRENTIIAFHAPFEINGLSGLSNGSSCIEMNLPTSALIAVCDCLFTLYTFIFWAIIALLY